MVIKMKLAEALQERADLNRRIEQLNARLYRNSKVDCLKIKIDAYRDLAGNASSLCDRVTRSEIVILSTVDVRALQKQIDAMSRELRCTDNMIQQLNWLTEIE